jgi:zinc protease
VTHSRTGTSRVGYLFAGCVALAAMMPLPSHAAARIQHLVSPGGIEAWFVQDATVPLVAMEFAMGGGAAQDPDGKAGVGNMVADLIDEGSADLDSRAFHEHLDRRAIELGFSITRDYFRGSLRMLKDNKDEAFDLLRMSLTSPHFDSADVERIRAQLISGLKRETSSPGSLATRKFLQIAYGDHPYGRPTGGTLESVPNITIADMKDYVGRVLTREQLKIAVVGDIDAASLGSLLDRAFGGLPAKSNLAW